MPSPELEVNSSARDWCASFFADVREVFGFLPLVVLSNPAPSVMKLQAERRLELWEKYVSACRQIARRELPAFSTAQRTEQPRLRVFPGEAIPSALRTAATVIRRDVPDARLSINFPAIFGHGKISCKNCCPAHRTQSMSSASTHILEHGALVLVLTIRNCLHTRRLCAQGCRHCALTKPSRSLKPVTLRTYRSFGMRLTN